MKSKTRKVEQEIMGALGGRRILASGAGMEKGDGRVPSIGNAPGYRLESKATHADSYLIKRLDWKDIVTSAACLGEVPLFHVRLRWESTLYEVDWILLPTDHADELEISSKHSAGMEILAARNSIPVHLDQPDYQRFLWKADNFPEAIRVVLVRFALFLTKVEEFRGEHTEEPRGVPKGRKPGKPQAPARHPGSVPTRRNEGGGGGQKRRVPPVSTRPVRKAERVRAGGKKPR